MLQNQSIKPQPLSGGPSLSFPRIGSRDPGISRPDSRPGPFIPRAADDEGPQARGHVNHSFGSQGRYRGNGNPGIRRRSRIEMQLQLSVHSAPPCSPRPLWGRCQEQRESFRRMGVSELGHSTLDDLLLGCGRQLVPMASLRATTSRQFFRLLSPVMPFLNLTASQQTL